MRYGDQKILSIQSSVAYGHVGNSAATFPLQRLGVEVWPVITVHFSNHTGYDTWRGPILPSEQIADVVTGIGERDAFPNCSAVLSGYLGAPPLGEVVLDAVFRVRAANDRAVYCCDPVMGDVGRGFFVKPGLPELIRDKAVPTADLITPNQFELEYLAGRTIADMADAVAAARMVQSQGPGTILITSLERKDGDPDSIESMVVTRDGVWRIATPKLPISVNGAGDMTAALFLTHWLGTDGDGAEAMRRTVESVYAVLEATVEAGTREIRMISAQAAIAEPPRRFSVEAVNL